MRIKLFSASIISILSLIFLLQLPSFSKDYTSVESCLKYGYELILNGKYQNALEHYTRALEKYSGNADIYYNLGVVFSKLGKLNDAIKMYVKAIELNSSDPEIHYNLGVIYGENEMWKEAAAEFKTVLEISPSYINAYYNLGIAYGKLGEWDSVLNTYQKLVKIAPFDMKVHYMLALTGVIKHYKKLTVREYKILKRFAPELAKEIDDIKV